MKKSALLLFIPFVMFSCNKNTTDMPKSPFNDDYVRIGMKGEYNVDLESLETEEYAKLKSAVNKDSYEDIGVTKVVRSEERRDLKYAYFGKEISSVSLCSMLSRTDTESKYVKKKNTEEMNYVTTKKAVSSLQNQTANAGIIKTDSTTADYIYDINYIDSKTPQGQFYNIRNSVKNNDEEAIVTQVSDVGLDYSSEKFDLLPYTSYIRPHFIQTDVRGVEYNFDILKDGNSAVYGKCNINDNDFYLIKEGYSLFAPYTTTVGRTYKAVDNYFYEGLLEEYTKPGESEKSFRFVTFRFYHELLILSKAYDEGVPILYLEKPMVVEYNEIKYEISYDSLGDCKEEIPAVTPANE